MIWLVLAVVAAGLARLVWGLRRGLSRQGRLTLLCRRAGLEFAAMDLFETSAWLPFPMFGRSGHGTENVVWEGRRGFDIRAFDFWYEDASDDRPVGPRRRLTCAVVPLGTSGRRLRVGPRDVDDELRSVLGLREIELELEDFNRRFAVHTEDERFAISFLEQRMMEAILALPLGVALDVNEDTVLLSGPELPPEQVLRLFDAAVAIHERIPRSLPSLYPPRPTEGPHEDRWFQGHWSSEPIDGPGA